LTLGLMKKLNSSFNISNFKKNKKETIHTKRSRENSSMARIKRVMMDHKTLLPIFSSICRSSCLQMLKLLNQQMLKAQDKSVRYTKSLSGWWILYNNSFTINIIRNLIKRWIFSSSALNLIPLFKNKKRKIKQEKWKQWKGVQKP